MKLMEIYPNANSNAEKILRFLREEGPKSRGELAKELGMKPTKYDSDIEELRKQYQNGTRKSPPRRNTIVYTILPGTLGYMSRSKYKTNWTDSWESFMLFYKPWIINVNSKWVITEYGLRALEVVDEKERN